MKFSTRLVERYVAGAILPYLLLSLLLLTAVLVAQQSSRFAELLGQVQAPLSFVLEIILNIIPGLLLFTIPMSVLTGTLIGFSRLGSDSELTALRAAGIGTLRTLSAPLVIGVAGTILTLYIGIFYTPVAAARLRDAALRAAVEKLKSPIQPGTFATNVGDKVIYVREGDSVSGEWKGVFVFSQEAEGKALVVTAEGGRLDSSQDVAELVLRNATATTINLPQTSQIKGDRHISQKEGGISSRPQSITERSAQSRIKLDDQLGILVERLRSRRAELDELDWEQLLLATRAARTPQQRLSARIILHKKLALGFAPLCFALLGAVIGLRVKRGGRGAGALLSLILMIVYYLAALAGEQLARTDVLPVPIGVWGATVLTFLIACGLLMSSRVHILPSSLRTRLFASKEPHYSPAQAPNNSYASSTRPALQLSTLLVGLLDRTLFGSLLLNFIFALLALTSVFMVFTVFELWRYIAANDVGWHVVAQYMLFLIPFIFATLTSVAVLVAVLLTYAVLSRRSEVVAWLACGQSVYRLAIPSFIFALTVGGILWVCQDTVLPYANERQDALRAKIRGAKTPTLAVGGRRWILSPDKTHILSFDSKGLVGNDGTLISPLIFRTAAGGAGGIDRIAIARQGELIETQTSADRAKNTITLSDATVFGLNATGIYSEDREDKVNFQFALNDLQEFAGESRKPAHMNSEELKLRINQMETRGDQNGASKARLSLARRSVEAVTPLVMSIIAMPLAIAFGRRSALVSLCAAVLVGILFWGITSLFDLLGTYGLLPVGIAAWGSTLVFGVLGFYLISRTKT